MEDDKILDVTNDVKWIGVLDPGLVVFDIVMETKYGTTYNSYFINAEKKAIVETTKAKFGDVYLDKIKRLVNPEEIDFIIMNHTEPDHSGNLGKLLEIAPNAKVVGTGNAIRYLTDQYGKDFPHIIVKDGHTLDLGNKTIKFIGAANLHWPDTMYSYLVEDKVLFTCDSFGSHYCKEEMFDDLCGDFDDAFTYYFDAILSHYSKFMLKAIEKIRPLDISVIATGHGPILRRDWAKYVDLSEEYAKHYLLLADRPRVFIPFVSAYNMTANIASCIADGIRQAGNIEVIVCDIEHMPVQELNDNLAKSTGLIVGSPTINKNTFIQIYQLMAVINPLRERGKLAAVFSSYGWSGEAVKIIRDNLANLKLQMFEEDFTVKFALHEDDIERCLDFGRRFGTRLLENKIAED